MARDVPVSNGTQASAGAVICDVPVAGHQDIDTAGRDFGGLAGLVKAKKVQVEG